MWIALMSTEAAGIEKFIEIWEIVENFDREIFDCLLKKQINWCKLLYLRY